MKSSAAQTSGALGWLSRQLNEKLLWLLVASYVLAAFCPTLGLRLRGLTVGTFTLHEQRTRVSLPMAMLALLLFNAGLGVRLSHLRGLARHPLPLAAGLIANLALPIGFIFALSHALRWWHDPDEAQHILIGLAVISAMPIAGSSTAWSQNVNGDLALSLGLVLLSTFLSPWTTPAVFHAIGRMAQGDYASALFALASHQTDAFLALCVVIPSISGVAARVLLGDERALRMQPAIKVMNALNLLLLCYSNAAISLPQVVVDPDLDFLAAIGVVVVALCVLAFAMGALLARLLRLNRNLQVSLMFGLGMNNNGTGLVLASMTLAALPRVMLPVVFYNLVQHIIAGVVAVRLSRRART